MSFYNMIHGMNPATFLLLPMLGRHPDEYPRFRDCFVGDDNDTIVILTRVGGNNRVSCGEEILKGFEGFIRTWDREDDNTYGLYEYSIPERWMDDYRKITLGNLTEISKEYREEMNRVYPKLKDEFEEILKGKRY